MSPIGEISPSILPLANRLEKSASVRLKRASPPMLSQESKVLAVRSLSELTILLLSSRLLFFCKNPKWWQGEEESAGWLRFPYMSAAFSLCEAHQSYTVLSLCFTEQGSHPALESPIYELGGCRLGRCDISTKLKPSKNISVSCFGCKFLLKLLRRCKGSLQVAQRHIW